MQFRFIILLEYHRIANQWVDGVLLKSASVRGCATITQTGSSCDITLKSHLVVMRLQQQMLIPRRVEGFIFDSKATTSGLAM